jgi:hypothetical protein
MDYWSGRARFDRCSFRNVDIREGYLFHVELVDCTFTGRLRKIIFSGTVPRQDRQFGLFGRWHNEFRGNDFSSAELIEVDFRNGIDLSKQRLPSGPDYLYLANAADALRQAQAEVRKWPDLNMRNGALGMIEILRDQHQSQIIVRPRDFYDYPACATAAGA